MSIGIFSKDKSSLIQEFSTFEGDTGSVPVQVALLSQRIKEITIHQKLNPKDFDALRSLIKLVGKRVRMMAYYKKIDSKACVELAKRLEIRNVYDV